jgi:hypothetical protein
MPMSRTVESYIDKPRKFVHDAFGWMTVIATFASFTGFMAGKPGFCVVTGLAALLFAYLMSKIKYTWVKEIEVGIYKLV